METIQQKLLNSYVPVNLQVNDIGKKFIFVFNNRIITGIFNGFNNGNPNYARVSSVNVPVGIAPGQFLIFRVSDLNENILNIINKYMKTNLPSDIIS